MHELYQTYIDYMSDMFDINYFKQHPSYTCILEHVDEPQGYDYYVLLKKEYGLSDNTIQEFCIQNDSIGNPLKFSINGIICSPTSLRYLYHACQIVNNVDNRDIIEVGGGYGGLCLAIDFVSKLQSIKIKSYTIIDLEEANTVQAIYLENFTLQYDVTFLSASDYKNKLKSTDYFLISNYCISEINEVLRRDYTRFLFPFVESGFITWNMIPLDENMFKDFRISVETERPLTGQFNLYIHFNRY
jgi:hypothetical protein